MHARTASASPAISASSSSTCSAAEASRRPASTSACRPYSRERLRRSPTTSTRCVVARQGQQAEVEAAGRPRGSAIRSPVAARRDDLLGERPQRLERAGSAVPASATVDRDLDQRADLRVLVQLPLGDLGDPEALVRHGVDQALLGEVEHRLAHRRGRDAEAGGQRGRRVHLARAQLPGDQRGPQRVRDLLAVAGPLAAQRGRAGALAR